MYDIIFYNTAYNNHLFNVCTDTVNHYVRDAIKNNNHVYVTRPLFLWNLKSYEQELCIY